MRLPPTFLRLLLIVTILDVTGGHWMLLQTVAWSRMVVDYSQRASLGQAVAETFDGEHPCEMCRKIQKASQTEKKQEMQRVVLKREFLGEPTTCFYPVFSRFSFVSSCAGLPASRGERPPIPPPRNLVS